MKKPDCTRFVILHNLKKSYLCNLWGVKMDTVDRIFALLEASGVEQKAFAADLGLAENVISTWRTGRTKSYRKYLPQIAAALDTTVEYLLTGEEKKPGPEQGAELIPGWSDLSTENKIRTQEYIALLLASQRKD